MRFFAGPTLLVIDLCRLPDYADEFRIRVELSFRSLMSECSPGV